MANNVLRDVSRAAAAQELYQWICQLPPRDATLLTQALETATALHAGQRRHSPFGIPTPYIYHPQRVALQLTYWGVDDPEILAAAILHDTIEDCTPQIVVSYSHGATPEEWLRNNFGTRTGDIVMAVTNRPEMTYAQMIAAIASGATEALLVKAADLIDNAGSLPYPISDSDTFSHSRAAKYRPAVAVIADELNQRGLVGPAGELEAILLRLDAR